MGEGKKYRRGFLEKCQEKAPVCYRKAVFGKV
jgi:hypothetical protein